MGKLPNVVCEDSSLGSRVISYMRSHMAMSDWDTDHEQNWIAGHMANFGRLERRRIRRLVAPHLDDLRRVYMAMPFSPVRSELVVLVGRIDAATKAPRKARKGK